MLNGVINFVGRRKKKLILSRLINQCPLVHHSNLPNLTGYVITSIGFGKLQKVESDLYLIFVDCF